ncbi:hypothetical protein [Cytobacillus purgationiresistens]|uniref:PXO1-76 n=1 Tax=Cytobacillus purgationiresistens TaxID=863449 RepID=A0ABU0AQF1_9BACI|nr:hypothetical protein [Cytobacillus purgationiresistens]MDQ0273494.1 hypothetical protein [Cytobacillus purgationiresistens]
MKDILFLVSVSLILYVVSRIILKEPILPWKEKNTKKNQQHFKPKQQKQVDDDSEEEAAAFRKLFPNIHSIENHMIRHNDNTFSIMAEVDPVNYYLLDDTEQGAIDAVFETWCAQANYNFRIYLQNRFVDLTDPIKEIEKTMDDDEELPELAYQYGKQMIQDLEIWQRSQPRFETKKFLIWDYKIDLKDIRAEDEEELEEKIIDKAFNELYRRLMTAKSQLRKANMDVQMLTTEGIGEVLYYAFNRRKAVKNRFNDIEDKEQLALYVTADQTATHIAKVKGEIESVKEEAKKEKTS